MLDSLFGITDTDTINQIKRKLKEFPSYQSMDALDSGKGDWDTLSGGQKQILHLAVNIVIASKTPERALFNHW
ncbi:MAG: hypothetical protein LVR00_06145 [Rhabdochlamydiaceae bacterium]|jgi:energy-coupling factor transporter ATP-binding protein EcfA2